MNKNRLYCGDCKDVLNNLIQEGAQVDLIYLDPPFNSNAVYNLTYKSSNNKTTAQQKAFNDMWSPTAQTQLMFEGFIDTLNKNTLISQSVKTFLGAWLSSLNEGNYKSQKLLNYLLYMTERLILMKGILKDTGSIFLHCDTTASHYLKVIMDGIFGNENFRNEIIWKRKNEKHNLAQKHMGKIHDVILYYSRSYKHEYNILYTPYDTEYISSNYKHKDNKGYYATFPATNDKGGNKEYDFRGIVRAWRFSPETMLQMYNDDMLTQATPTSPFRYKKYLSTASGIPIQDIWEDLPPVRGEESLGYPTQKPVALLERIINIAANSNSIVLDPFCGCGTTIEAAIRLNKKWIGIDISSFSIDIIENRIKDSGLTEQTDYIKEYLRPKTWDEYQKLDPYQKQDFLIQSLGGMPNHRKSGDGGIDGELTIHMGVDKDKSDIWGKVIFSVKTGKQSNPAMIRELKGTLQNFKADIGILILDKDPSFIMQEDAEASKKIKYSLNETYPPQEFNTIQIYTAEQILNGVLLACPPSMLKIKEYKKLQQELFNH